MSEPGRFVDFDAARAERRREPVVVRLFGRDWELPPALPARVVVDVIRYHRQGRKDTDLTLAEVMSLMGQIVPEATLEQWLAGGLDEDEYGELLAVLMQVYRGASGSEAIANVFAPEPSGNGDGAAEVAAPRPKRARPRRAAH